MSILLEALRKSEKHQHSPGAPNIHTDDQPGPASDSIKTGPLALLLVVALFASGWFVWQQYQPQADSDLPPVSVQADQTGAVTTPAVSPAADAGETAQVVPSSTVANNSADKPRTPVESYQAAASMASQEELTRQAQANTVRPKENDPDKQLVDNSDKQSVSRAAASQEPVTVIKDEPREPAPISYWELPDAIRADIPEIKFSVLVFAKNPADRFVLINGQRLAEGDSPQSGLVVKEIRREGVVFSYRLYQFLVER